MTQKHKDAISRALKGRKHTKKTCDLISKAHKGKKFSKEHRKKISEGQKKRWSKIPKSGRKRKFSDAHKRKISKAMKKAWSNKTRAEMWTEAIRRSNRCATRVVRRGVVAILRADIVNVVSVRYAGIQIQEIYHNKNEHGYPRCCKRMVATYEVVVVQGRKRALATALKAREFRKCLHGWNVGTKAFVKVL